MYKKKTATPGSILFFLPNPHPIKPAIKSHATVILPFCTSRILAESSHNW